MHVCRLDLIRVVWQRFESSVAAETLASVSQLQAAELEDARFERLERHASNDMSSLYAGLATSRQVLVRHPRTVASQGKA